MKAKYALSIDLQHNSPALQSIMFVGPFWSFFHILKIAIYYTTAYVMSKYSVTTNEEKGALSLYRLVDFLNQQAFIDI